MHKHSWSNQAKDSTDFKPTSSIAQIGLINTVWSTTDFKLDWLGIHVVCASFMVVVITFVVINLLITTKVITTTMKDAQSTNHWWSNQPDYNLCYAIALLVINIVDQTKRRIVQVGLIKRSLCINSVNAKIFASDNQVVGLVVVILHQLVYINLVDVRCTLVDQTIFHGGFGLITMNYCT